MASIPPLPTLSEESFSVTHSHSFSLSSPSTLILSAAEVPTIAFEYIYIKNNTSVIVDEVLAHRIGLLPIQVDPRPFLFQSKGEAPSDNVRMGL